MKHWQYLKYVLRHKLYVYQAGRELGVGRCQLLIHDWHKLTRGEWSPYVEMFYGGEYPTHADSTMVYPLYKGPTKESIQEQFDLAWNRHQKRAKHHWQWWLMLEDDGGTKVLEIPDKYRREMLADWRGAGRAIHGHDETATWYQQNKNNMQLHPKTRAWVETELGVK